ncbi:MAG: hypothetical protein IPH29_11330 [Candidatus Microthrix sp.]|nr:hypothetical protein [Candidatus Microthrix sp.]
MTLNQLSGLTRSIWAETDDELFRVGPNLALGTWQLRLVAPRIFSAPDLRTMLIRDLDQATRVLTAARESRHCSTTTRPG